MKPALKTTIAFYLLMVTIAAPSMAGPPPAKTDDGLNWGFAYDDEDRVTTVTDPAGRIARLKYSTDKEQRLRKVERTTADGATTVREFDESGRLIKMTDGAGTVSYGYDSEDRLNLVERKGTAAIRYTYDSLDRITSLQVGDFYRIDYRYDFLGRLESMKTPAGEVRYEFLTGQGQVRRTLPNGVTTIWTFAPGGKLQQITHADARLVILAQYTYRYRPDGLIEGIEEQSPTGRSVKAYTYDVAGRLVEAVGPQGQKYSYEYDQVGNRLRSASHDHPARNYTYDWAGRLTSVDGKPTAHDAAGNLTSLPLDGSTLTYRHNQDGQVVEVVGGKASFSYDGDGRLILRSSDSEKTSFISDPFAAIWRPLFVKNSEGHRTLLVWWNTTPLVSILDGKPSYFLEDHLGSVRIIVDSIGKPYQWVDYDPFGSAIGAENRKDFGPRFAGLFRDSEADGYLTLARIYSPKLGRFLTPDPQIRIPKANDTSIYGYAASDPVNLIDIDGAEAQSPVVLNEGTIWWNAFRKEVTWENVFNRDRAMEMYAALSNSHLTNARGTGVLAGLTALGFDILAGYVGGKPVTKNQSLAKLGWTVLPSAARVAPFLKPLLDKINFGREAGMYFYALAEKNYREAALLFLSMGLGTASREIPPFPSQYQYQLPFSPEVVRLERLYKLNGPVHASNELLSSATLTYDSWEHIKTWIPSRTNNPLRASPDTPLPAITQWHGASFYTSSRPLTSKEHANWKSQQHASTSPSPVGGVYLSGAGKLIEDLGELEGVALDANNNLLLIGKGGTDIGLPPLRLDDVVTVFRSVYLHGEGPTVTIDPNPENPEGSAMIIRHGKATENTYVGWVLYQADRLMKGYTLGRDNITTQEVKSRVPGYKEILEEIYFGRESPEQLRKHGRWERFWIVPGETRRFEGSKNGVTVFDVPLKVNTQPMKWSKGALEDDRASKPSPGAATFSQWFSKEYDRIAKEQFLPPPPESGLTAPVPVFTELRRIALLTAIAEKLRDQGVPIPFWMRDYEVRTVPFERFTPALRTPPRHKNGVIAHAFGGVNLSPADKDVSTFTPSSNLTSLPKKEEQVSIREKLALADSLMKPVQQEMAFAVPLTVRQFAHNGGSYQAVALPGTETQALAPGLLEVVDIVVPIEGGRSIQLARSFNSFFDPNGPWGKGWVLDLPQLIEAPIPVSRAGNKTTYHMTYELITPLNSLYAHFVRVADVPALNHSRLQVPDRPSEFFGLADDRPKILSGPTRKAIRKDGSAWHFTTAGDLVAVEDAGFWTVYERDTSGRVSRIVGILGQRALAFIDLTYNASGHLVSAKGRQADRTTGDEVAVRYEYDGTGRLAGVISGASRVGYRYQGSWVKAVTQAILEKNAKPTQEVTLQSFEYNALGQVISTSAADGPTISSRVTAHPADITVEASSSGKDTGTASVRFDRAFRPVQATFTNGVRAAWKYPDKGGASLDLTDPEGGSIQLVESPDQRRRTVTLDSGLQFTGEYDLAGRLTAFSRNGRQFLKQEWTPDGRLAGVKDEFSSLHQEYDADGLLSKVTMSPLDESGQLRHWQSTTMSPAGQPLEITDYHGLHRSFGYGQSGELESAVEHRDGKRYGFQVSRDKSGRIQHIQSSWGKGDYTYDNEGLLTKAVFSKEGKAATAEWKSGLVQKVHDLDGGDLSFSYYQDGNRAGLLKELTTPDRLSLRYQYDRENRLSEVSVGDRYRIVLEYDSKGRLITWQTHPVKR